MGQPRYSNVYLSTHESIVCEKETQGTETSKYLQEKKETSIPQVAASERGPSPNHGLVRGVADHSKDDACIVERPGKAGDTG